MLVENTECWRTKRRTTRRKEKSSKHHPQVGGSCALRFVFRSNYCETSWLGISGDCESVHLLIRRMALINRTRVTCTKLNYSSRPCKAINTRLSKIYNCFQYLKFVSCSSWKYSFYRISSLEKGWTHSASNENNESCETAAGSSTREKVKAKQWNRRKQ